MNYLDKYVVNKQEKAMKEGNTEEDIESLIDGMAYIPGHFHLDLNLNHEPSGPGELRRRDTQLKVDSLGAELEAEVGYCNILSYGYKDGVWDV